MTALVTIGCLIMFNSRSYTLGVPINSMLLNDEVTNNFWLAALSGIFAYFSFYYMTKTFETSSSTIIRPLIQVCSTATILMSIVQKAIIGGVILKSGWHAVSYVCLFLGGLLPATSGNLGSAMSSEFWKQKFI